MTNHLIVALAAVLVLAGCDSIIAINFTTPAERAALAYVGCANYWRLHPEQEQDMKELSAFIHCPADQGSHCLCADWEGAHRKYWEDNERDER